MGEKARRPSIATSSVLHDYMEGDIVPLVRSVIDSSHGANFQSSFYFGRVVDQELKSNQVLALPNVDRKRSISNG
jgi:hypothetical protein